MLHRTLTGLAVATAAALAAAAGSPSGRLDAQAPGLSNEVRRYVSLDAPVVAITHARVIDGTGAAPTADQTIVIRGGTIASVGSTGATAVPPDAKVVDATGKTVIPGLVMVHEHLFYPAGGGGAYNSLTYSFPRLYLAGGVTTMRTAGAMAPYADINLRKWIEAGQVPGPAIDSTSPYLNGPGLPIPYVKALADEGDARRMVEFWAGEGSTSFKAYMQITRAELAAGIEAAHRRGAKVTGHLCSVTFAEAADLGIDNLEHGLVSATDFVADKAPDQCPPGDAMQRSLSALDVNGPAAQALIRKLVDKKVAITSTLPVFETMTPGRPPAADRAIEAMALEARDAYLRRRAAIAVDLKSPYAVLFRKEMEFEHAFARAGGLLVAGTDPTGYGGVVAGFANQREIELLVDAGFAPVEAIKIATLDGATFLGRAARVGSIAVGKQADLVLIDGDPSARIADIERVVTVFKQGVGYDPEKLIAATKGLVGLR